MDNKKRAEEFAEGKRRLEEIGNRLGTLFGSSNATSSVGGFFTGLGGLVENLGKFVEESEKTGDSFSKTGEFKTDSEKGVRGVYGFSVKTMGGRDKGVKIEPFGNIKTDEEGKTVEVQQIREPMVDLFDESDRVLIIAEVPGITEDSVKVEVNDDILTLSAERGETRYGKEMLLPASFKPEQMSWHCRNGILEIRLSKS